MVTDPGFAEHVGFDASGSTGGHVHLVLELLPDPWHSQEDGWPDFIEGSDNGALESIGLGKPYRVPSHQHGDDVYHHGCHVAEGKVAYDLVIL